MADPSRTRTAGNVKDKFKQLGGEHAVQRNVGPWSIQEALMLVQLVIKATEGRILKKSRELVFSQNKEQREERFKFNQETGKVTIYHPDKVKIDEILPLLIKPKRARKHFQQGEPGSSISWTAIQNELKTRSIDDIRNYWQLKILPIFDQAFARNEESNSVVWHEKDDIQLLEGIAEQEITDPDEVIDFSPSTIGNKMKFGENEMRWRLLLKGLGSIVPGKRFNPTQIALKMIGDIETKDQRYVAHCQPLSKPRAEATGMNSFVDILDYFKKHFR